MAKPIILRVHEAQVMAFNRPGGEVWDLVQRTTRRTWLLSKTFAPKRTGHLTAGILYDRPKITGPYTNEGRVYSTTAYSLYVIGGTTGPIRSSRPGGWMLVDGWLPVKQVKGQRANDFLTRALNVALRMKR